MARTVRAAWGRLHIYAPGIVASLVCSWQIRRSSIFRFSSFFGGMTDGELGPFSVFPKRLRLLNESATRADRQAWNNERLLRLRNSNGVASSFSFTPTMFNKLEEKNAESQFEGPPSSSATLPNCQLVRRRTWREQTWYLHFVIGPATPLLVVESFFRAVVHLMLLSLRRFCC